jgi:ABC-2 type transport system ATP-binding protein
LRKNYLIEREDISLVAILSEVGSGRDLKDVALHEPDIEEVIRTFYQRRNADQRSNAKARAS